MRKSSMVRLYLSGIYVDENRFAEAEPLLLQVERSCASFGGQELRALTSRGSKRTRKFAPAATKAKPPKPTTCN